MIRKLKQKFVLINMLSVGAILLIVLSIITVTSYQRQQDEIQKALSDTLTEGYKKVAPSSRLGHMMTRFIFKITRLFLSAFHPTELLPLS